MYIHQASGDVYTLTMYVDDVIFLGEDVTVLENIKHQLMGRSSMTDMRDISLVLRMEFVHDRYGKSVSISQIDHTESLPERYGMASYNPAYTPGVGQEPSLDELQVVACSVTYFAHATRYDIVRGTYGSCKTPASIFGRHNRPRYHLQPGRFLYCELEQQSGQRLHSPWKRSYFARR